MLQREGWACQTPTELLMKNSSISLKKGVRQNNNSNSKTKKKETVVFYSQHKKALAVGKATVLCDGPWFGFPLLRPSCWKPRVSTSVRPLAPGTRKLGCSYW